METDKFYLIQNNVVKNVIICREEDAQKLEEIREYISKDIELEEIIKNDAFGIKVSLEGRDTLADNKIRKGDRVSVLFNMSCVATVEEKNYLIMNFEDIKIVKAFKPEKYKWKI